MARLSCLISLMASLVLRAGGSCDAKIVQDFEQFFGASNPQGLVSALLKNVQDECSTGDCPQVAVAGCQQQSIDDIHCEVPHVFTSKVKLGTDAICDAGCSDWPCKAACNGIDVGICYGADYVLCKAGCLGISSCVHKCEHAIVEPCKKKLIDECSNKCEDAFHKCKSSCEAELSMDIVGDLERVQRALSSMHIDSVDLDCVGSGINDPLFFNSTAAVNVGDVAVDLKVQIKDAGILSTNSISLKKATLTLSAPVNGSFLCGLEAAREVNVSIGHVSVLKFNLDVDLQLDNTLDAIASVICAGLKICKDAIRKSISTAIKNELMAKVPQTLAEHIGSATKELVKKAKCPKIGIPKEAPDPSLVI